MDRTIQLLTDMWNRLQNEHHNVVTEENYDALKKAIKALEQTESKPSYNSVKTELDVISRESIKQKLQEHHDFYVNAYGGFSNLPQNDKSRVDEIANCIAMVVNEPPVAPQPRWIPVSERLPETDNENNINNYNVLLWVKNKTHPEYEPQIYLGKLRHVDGDDGSGNFWGLETKPCDWTIWAWHYFNEPEVIAWMPLPQPYKAESEE